MLTLNKTQSLNYSDDINNLICQIDTWLSKEAMRKLNNDRYGDKACVNEDDFKLISKYRQILLNKAQNSHCLIDYLIDDIISRIKHLLNRNQQ